MRGVLNDDPAQPFVVLATQDREVVRYSSSVGLTWFGSVNPTEVDNPGQYASHHADLDKIVTAVGQVVDGAVTSITAGSYYIVSYEGYEPLEIIGTAPNRSYQPYTPQFVDL